MKTKILKFLRTLVPAAVMSISGGTVALAQSSAANAPEAGDIQNILEDAKEQASQKSRTLVDTMSKAVTDGKFGVDDMENFFVIPTQKIDDVTDLYCVTIAGNSKLFQCSYVVQHECGLKNEGLFSDPQLKGMFDVANALVQLGCATPAAQVMCLRQKNPNNWRPVACPK